MTQSYVIRSLPQAYEVIKQMNLSPGWGSDYRSAAREALVEILEDWMNASSTVICGRWGGRCRIAAFFWIKDPNLWPQIRTTNAIERKFREVRRRTRPMRVFSDRTSMERILYAVFAFENLKEKTWTPFLMKVAQNSCCYHQK